MNVGILSTGIIAGAMARTLSAMEGATCLAVASRELDKAHAFAKAHNIPRAYGSYDELITDKDIELVYVALPNTLHYKYTKRTLEAGKPVLCEKPFTVTAAEAESLVAISREKSVFLCEAMWTRFMPVVPMIRQRLEKGCIGKIVSLQANLGYRLTHVERLVKHAYAGGALLDLGVYPINFARMYHSAPIDEVISDAVLTDERVDEQNSILLHYRDGVTASLYSTMLANTDRRGVIYGTNGYLAVDNINNPARVDVYDGKCTLTETFFAPAQISGYEYQVEAAKKAIAAGRIECEEMPHEETLSIMRIVHKLRESWGSL